MKKVTFFRETIALDILLYLYSHQNENIFARVLANKLELPDTQVLSEVYTLVKLGLIKTEKIKNESKRIRFLKLTDTSLELIPHILKMKELLKWNDLT